MEVEISCMTYEEKEIRTIQDMYCPGQKMEFDCEELIVEIVEHKNKEDT